MLRNYSTVQCDQHPIRFLVEARLHSVVRGMGVDRGRSVWLSRTQRQANERPALGACAPDVGQLDGRMHRAVEPVPSRVAGLRRIVRQNRGVPVSRLRPAFAQATAGDHRETEEAFPASVSAPESVRRGKAIGEAYARASG